MPQNNKQIQNEMSNPNKTEKKGKQNHAKKPRKGMNVLFFPTQKQLHNVYHKSPVKAKIDDVHDDSVTLQVFPEGSPAHNVEKVLFVDDTSNKTPYWNYPE